MATRRSTTRAKPVYKPVDQVLRTFHAIVSGDTATALATLPSLNISNDDLLVFAKEAIIRDNPDVFAAILRKGLAMTAPLLLYAVIHGTQTAVIALQQPLDLEQWEEYAGEDDPELAKFVPLNQGYWLDELSTEIAIRRRLDLINAAGDRYYNSNSIDVFSAGNPYVIAGPIWRALFQMRDWQKLNSKSVAIIRFFDSLTQVPYHVAFVDYAKQINSASIFWQLKCKGIPLLSGTPTGTLRKRWAEKYLSSPCTAAAVPAVVAPRALPSANGNPNYFAQLPPELIAEQSVNIPQLRNLSRAFRAPVANQARLARERILDAAIPIWRADPVYALFLLLLREDILAVDALVSLGLPDLTDDNLINKFDITGLLMQIDNPTLFRRCIAAKLVVVGRLDAFIIGMYFSPRCYRIYVQESAKVRVGTGLDISTATFEASYSARISIIDFCICYKQDDILRDTVNDSIVTFFTVKNLLDKQKANHLGRDTSPFNPTTAEFRHALENGIEQRWLLELLQPDPLVRRADVKASIFWIYLTVRAGRVDPRTIVLPKNSGEVVEHWWQEVIKQYESTLQRA